MRNFYVYVWMIFCKISNHCLDNFKNTDITINMQIMFIFILNEYIEHQNKFRTFPFCLNQCL